MTLHRVGSAAWRKSRQTPISKSKPARPRRIQERNIDWDAAAGQEWIDTYLPDADTTGYDPVRVAQSIQAELAAGREPTLAAVIAAYRATFRAEAVKNARRRTAPAIVPASTSLECPRCGQVFRFTTGRAWHLANRPACKQEAMRRMVA